MDELATLHRSLQQNQRVAVIAGMGGVGKTELALQYALEHDADYPGGICWLRAREGSLTAQLLQMMESWGREVPQKLSDRPLTLSEQVQWCWRNWQPDGKVLVVLDDVTELSEYPAVLPTQAKFCVVMTTRLRSIDTSFEELPLEVLSDEKALELLGCILKGDRRMEREPAAAAQLCAVLGNLPLGLELVGRYLAKRRTLSIAALLNQLQLEADALERDPQYQMTVKRGVKAAFDLTWQALDPAAQEVALLLSWFALAEIPWYLVERMMQRVRGEDYALIEPTTELDNTFLIQPVAEGVYKLHPLIREFLGQQRQTAGQSEPYQQAFVDVLIGVAQQMPQTPTRNLIEAFAVVRPHLEVVAQAMTDCLSDEDLSWAFVGLARFFNGQGLYSLAEPWYQQCLNATQSRFGNEHPAVATSLNNLAALYNSQGRYSEAEPLSVQALALYKQLFGNEHPNVAMSLNNLAALYNSQGRYSEAEPLSVQALALYKQLFGNEHPNVATSLGNLAELYRSQGCYSEAEPLFVQALALYKQLFGNEHPLVAMSLNNLAALYDSQGRYSEAEPLFVQALALRQQLLGNEHPDAATSLNNLAELYRSQGYYSKAEPLFVQALALYKQLFGNEHPLVATSLNNLAALYDSQGRYSEAEPLFVQALALRQQLLGNEHPDVATSLNNLALLYRSQGRYSKAEPLFVQALALYKQLFGNEHPLVATSLNNLAALYDSQGRYSEAEPLFVQALMILEARLGANHPTTVTVRQNLESLRRRSSPTVVQQFRSLLTRFFQ